MADWLIKKDGREQGPFSPKAMKRMARSDDLAESDHVRRADQEQWRLAGKVRGLFDVEESSTNKRPSVSGKTKRQQKVKGKTKDRFFMVAGLLQLYVLLALGCGVGWVYLMQTILEFEVGSSSDRFFLSLAGAMFFLLLAAAIEYIAWSLLRFKRWAVIGAQAVFVFSFVGIFTLPFAVMGLWALFRTSLTISLKPRSAS